MLIGAHAPASASNELAAKLAFTTISVLKNELRRQTLLAMNEASELQGNDSNARHSGIDRLTCTISVPAQPDPAAGPLPLDLDYRSFRI